MSLLIVSSTEDPASTNIKESLFTQSTFEKTEYSAYHHPIFQHQDMDDIYLMTLNTKTIITEGIEDAFIEETKQKIDQIIYISRHRSKTGEKALTVHPIGNYGPALFGGKPRYLCPSSPRLMAHLLRRIKAHSSQQAMPHQVCFEVTHHGPATLAPTLFVEVGSNQEEWEKRKPAEIIASSLLDTLSGYHYESDLPKDIPVLIGLGGGHYAPRFSDLVFAKNVSFGHMIPNYQVNDGNINSDIIKQAIERTPNCQGCYIHKKGLKKSQVKEYSQLLDELEIPIISSKDLDDL